MGPHWVTKGVAGMALAVLLAGCGEKGQAPPAGQAAAPSRGYYKVGAPYEVEGVWYYPGADFSYDETGIASWYGPDFHGKYTANGEVYNMNDLTAAHPTLPLPSIVRVTNLDNGRSIVVRVNDRGPYVRGRIIDLSRRAAQLIGMIGTGTAKVRVQILPDESRQAVLLAQQGEIPSAERIASAVPTEKVTAETLVPPPGVAAARGPTPAAAPAAPVQPPPAPVVVASAQGAPLPAQGAPVAAPQPVESAPLSVPKAAGPSPMPMPAPAAADPVKAVLDQAVITVPVKATSIYVQVGAFSQYDNANRLRAKLSAMGSTKVTQASVDGLPFFRVRMGPATTVDDADRLLDLVVRAGYHDARIVVE